MNAPDNGDRETHIVQASFVERAFVIAEDQIAFVFENSTIS
jgi:hypothetical protein